MAMSCRKHPPPIWCIRCPFSSRSCPKCFRWELATSSLPEHPKALDSPVNLPDFCRQARSWSAESRASGKCATPLPPHHQKMRYDVSLHRLTQLTIGVPNVDEVAQYYADFGLTPVEPVSPDGPRRFCTVDGGQQLILVHRPIRQLVEIVIGADDHDDLGRIQSSLNRGDHQSR